MITCVSHVRSGAEVVLGQSVDAGLVDRVAQARLGEGTAITPALAPTMGVTIWLLRGGWVTSQGRVQPGRLPTATVAALASPVPWPPAHWMSQPAATARSWARRASLSERKAVGRSRSTRPARSVR